MRYNVYCDEASTHGGVRYMLIGGLWVPWDIERSVRDTISDVRDQHHLRAEMKWTKVSRTICKKRGQKRTAPWTLAYSPYQLVRGSVSSGAGSKLLYHE